MPETVNYNQGILFEAKSIGQLNQNSAEWCYDEQKKILYAKYSDSSNHMKLEFEY